MEVDDDAATNSGMPSSAAGAGATSSSRRRLKVAMRGRNKPPPPPQTRWRSSAQERIYSRRLLEALRSTAADGSDGGAAVHQPSSSRAIKEAADSALALTAQGRSRWSRAILKRRWRVRKVLLKAGGKVVRGRGRGSKGRGWEAGAAEEKRRGAVAAGQIGGKKVRERLRTLSRLVPGCRKASTPKLLEEAADYVAALELQVKTMRVLADALSSAAAAAAAPPPSTSSSPSLAGASGTPPPPSPPTGSPHNR